MGRVYNVLFNTHDGTESCRQMVLIHGLHKSIHCSYSLHYIQCTGHGVCMVPRSLSLPGIKILQCKFVSWFAACPNETAFQMKVIFTRCRNVNEV